MLIIYKAKENIVTNKLNRKYPFPFYSSYKFCLNLLFLNYNSAFELECRIVIQKQQIQKKTITWIKEGKDIYD